MKGLTISQTCSARRITPSSVCTRSMSPVGLLLMITVSVFGWFGLVKRSTPTLSVVALYWHFVDVVWVVVFTGRYLVGR